jgi:hypothetical protein
MIDNYSVRSIKEGEWSMERSSGSQLRQILKQGSSGHVVTDRGKQQERECISNSIDRYGPGADGGFRKGHYRKSAKPMRQTPINHPHNDLPDNR